MCASKKVISARQIQRMLSCSMKTAWFLTQRIREAMRDNQLTPFGGEGADVQVDETYIGNLPDVKRPKGGFRHKMRVVSLLDKRTGQTRSFYAPSHSLPTAAQIVCANVEHESHLVTDEARYYWKVGKEFAGHTKVFHGAGNYVKDGRTTNDIEGFFSIFKRGMRGIYQHCAEQHLHRYLAEFDFRYSDRSANGIEDTERASIAFRGVVGKRLTYKSVNGFQAAYGQA